MLYFLCASDYLIAENKLISQIKDLSLADAVHNEIFNVDTVRGKVCVFECVRIHCEGPCRIIAGKLRQIKSTLKADPGILFVTLLLDGEDCTSEEVDSFSQGDNKQSDSVYLKGSDEAVRKALNAIYAPIISSPEAAEGGLLLNTRWVVLDQSGRIFGYYSSLDKGDREKMVADIHSLLEGRK